MTRPSTARQELRQGSWRSGGRRSFADADLTSVRLTGAWLSRISFRSADLRHATLDGCYFKLCDFAGAGLRGASLRGVRFAGCDLTGADLRDADLTGARFGSVLTGAPPHGLTVATGVLLAGATLRGTELEPGGVLDPPDGLLRQHGGRP